MTRGSLQVGRERDCCSNLAERQQPSTTNHWKHYTMLQPSFKPRNVGHRGLSFRAPLQQRQLGSYSSPRRAWPVTPITNSKGQTTYVALCS
jgi:hypothetical protein